jgi:micrococcal nuclease
MKILYRYRRLAVLASLVLCVLSVSVYVIRAQEGINIDPTTYYSVTYVIDGDTFKVKIKNKNITIRVLGINTPETVDPRKSPQCFGPEASAEAKDLLVGRKVRLALNENREVTDKYGRYLAYVYRDDGLFYNKAMIEGGFAREYTYGTPYSMQADFRALESTARESQKGLWGVCATTI